MFHRARRHVLGALALAVMLAASASSQADAQTPAPPTSLLDAVKADAATSAGVPVASVQLLRADAVTWDNGCLGIPPSGSCTLALVEGYVVWVAAGTPPQAFRYHTNQSGSVIRLGASGIAPDAVPTAPLPGGATPSGGFIGEPPVPGSIALLVTAGQASAATLTSTLGGVGCSVSALAVLRSGAWLVYIPGAPAQVNAQFPPSLAATTPFFVRCAPDTAAPLTLFFATKPEAGGFPVTQVDVRAASHEGFDRLVLEFEGSVVPGYTIEYITPPAFSCGAGFPVTPAGGATLQIRLPSTYVYDAERGVLTVPRQLVPHLPTILEVTEICAFEAMAVWLVGVSERQPFRVFELSSPSRLVIDIAH